MRSVDDLTLVEPTLELKDQYLDVAREFVEGGDTSHGRWAVDESTFGEFVAGLAREARGIDLPADRVPQSTYWLLRADGVIVGTSRLRHHLIPAVEEWGGHIGYDVRPSERRKGYGTRLLALTLDKARALGLARVLLTCDDDNVGSYRVMENNGGRLADKVTPAETGRLTRRYWIVLGDQEP